MEAYGILTKEGTFYLVDKNQKDWLLIACSEDKAFRLQCKWNLLDHPYLEFGIYRNNALKYFSLHTLHDVKRVISIVRQLSKDSEFLLKNNMLDTRYKIKKMVINPLNEPNFLK